MVHKKREKEYDLLDIEYAVSGKAKVVKPKEDSVEPKKKSFSFFDFINDIRKAKTGKLMDTESNKKDFNSFMVLRGLSMKEDDLDLCNLLNQYQSILPKEALYEALLQFVPKDRKFYSYINTNTSSAPMAAEYVAKYYEIPINQAEEYIEIMGDEWVTLILEKFGEDVTNNKGVL